MLGCNSQAQDHQALNYFLSDDHMLVLQVNDLFFFFHFLSYNFLSFLYSYYSWNRFQHLITSSFLVWFFSLLPLSYLYSQDFGSERQRGNERQIARPVAAVGNRELGPLVRNCRRTLWALTPSLLLSISWFYPCFLRIDHWQIMEKKFTDDSQGVTRQMLENQVLGS